ncbi:hypothetical protein [Cryocola sp. 340MFSha3.1]|uniref:hypothetical protein n=1 Tax=Cryocola sp. 340MFSha3.1 TaxID=1169145 RepID=UPI0003728BEC|nr:hypothetical protein [Cryocola sp. 340MFSha3.1]
MLELAIDNDVLIKTSQYGRATDLIHLACEDPCSNSTGVLGSAPFVCVARIKKLIAMGTARAEAIDDLKELLSRAELLEPDDHEIALAAEIEEVALANDLAIDGGESLLLAVACLRGSSVLTGDKRAIGGVEDAMDHLPALAAIKFRTACLEQAIATLAARHGVLVIRANVCDSPDADVALTNAFECRRPSVPDDYAPDGLHSYIEEVRRVAPRVLMPGDVISLAGA